MTVVPVIDLFRGEVVRGVGGRRDEYRPIQSSLTPATNPVAIAEVLRNRFGKRPLYLADLDAILGGSPALNVYEALAGRGHRLWVDAGVSTTIAVGLLFNSGMDTIIVGLESCATPDSLGYLVREVGPERLLFSLDLRNGVPMRPLDWPELSAFEIAEAALAAGFRRLLVLDLTDVGTNTGGQTDALLRSIRQADRDLQLVAGGGVRGAGDLQRLESIGVDAVLVASALHDGRLTAAEIAQLEQHAD